MQRWMTQLHVLWQGLCSAYMSLANEHDSLALDLCWVNLLGKQQAFRASDQKDYPAEADGGSPRHQKTN